VYLGQRVIPDAWDPRADAMEAAELGRRLEDVRTQVSRAAAGMPTHEEFLKHYCPSGMPMPPAGARA
jgi:tryptophan halogenase